jgi:hypothetical protein
MEGSCFDYWLIVLVVTDEGDPWSYRSSWEAILNTIPLYQTCCCSTKLGMNYHDTDSIFLGGEEM